MNKHPSRDEYARAASPRPQTYAQGDRVRVSKTGELGTVLFTLYDSAGECTMVRMDGPDHRSHRYLTSHLTREDVLF